MRRDGLPAAVMQHVCPVDERGSTAHLDSLAWWSVVDWRASEGLVVTEEMKDNG